MKGWLIVLAVLLAGCGSQPAIPPPAPVVVVLCAVPGEMTLSEAEPVRPAGDYTQRQVALYLGELHRWGSGGWERLEAVRAWSNDCVDRATLGAGAEPR